MIKIISGMFIFLTMLPAKATSFEDARATGCWATLFNLGDYQGEQITVYDGSDLPEMNIKVKSIMVGPKARLILYGRTFWKDRDYTIAPATRVRSVETLPWNSVRSLKLSCVP